MSQDLNCRPLCRLHLVLAQQRQIKQWIEYTVIMLENSIVLYSFTLEAPWINFSPMEIRQKIRFFCSYHEKVNGEINNLIRITVSGCNYCRKATMKN